MSRFKAFALMECENWSRPTLATEYVNHFASAADQPMALAEAYRVLRSEGRFAMTVWCGPDQSASSEILYGAIRTFGDPSVSLPPGPDFHQFANPRVAKELLLAAGL